MKTREHRENRPRIDPTEEIRHEAYLLWLQDGCPRGRELDHWLAAQELVKHRARHVRANPAVDDERELKVRPTEQLVTPT
jgi:hypothetical protein